MPLPVGLPRRDLERAGIIDPEVICPDCDASVKTESHEDWCELKDADIQEVAEIAAEEQIATEYDPMEHKER